MMIGLSLLLGWLNNLRFADTGAIVACLVFVALFQLSSGPIAWLYIAEICND